MASVDNIKDISVQELRDIIDATTNQVAHLQRSQKELLAALKNEPDDSDFKEAYEENIITIQKKQKTIMDFKEHLKSVDKAFYLEHYKDHSVGTTSITGDTSAGVYL